MSYRLPSTSPDYNANGGIGKSFDDSFATQTLAASGAITIKEGTVFITKGSIAALTLALPTAGAQSAGGDDGKLLRVMTTTGYAHTVTTPAAGVNGASTTITWAAAVGNSVDLIAFNGSWYAEEKLGVTVS